MQSTLVPTARQRRIGRIDVDSVNDRVLTDPLALYVSRASVVTVDKMDLILANTKYYTVTPGTHKSRHAARQFGSVQTDPPIATQRRRSRRAGWRGSLRRTRSRRGVVLVGAAPARRLPRSARRSDASGGRTAPRALTALVGTCVGRWRAALARYGRGLEGQLDGARAIGSPRWRAKPPASLKGGGTYMARTAAMATPCPRRK